MSDKRKSSRRMLLLGVLLMISAALWAFFKLAAPINRPIAGETNSERTAYLESLGWEAAPVPCEQCNVRIPIKFDEAYEEYNAVQLKQGFDLRKYRARTVKKFTYELTNYSDTGELSPVPVYAELLVYEGEIIGGNIRSAQAGGFVTVLNKPQNE